jgi:2-phospho-L-lactate transferase/gluconeogenesis factor (CofD/UPF0052 family)
MTTDSCLHHPRLTVFKGGTAFNSLLREFQTQFPHTTYIVPITDDGGSSREIGRVFGGPSIGDLRSTLTRLSDESTAEACAVKKLLEYRLPGDDVAKAMGEWQALLEDRHPLYTSISAKYKGLIRCFLCKFEAERLHRISCNFDIRNGSIGNFFFSGARVVLGSLETAIFMYSSVARIPATTHVLPIIDSNDRLGIGVRLKNHEIVIGQHAISHPSPHGQVDKSISHLPLPAPIKQLFYVDKFKNVIHPPPHPEVIRHLERSRGVIYGMGSLWTSIIPSLVLEGIGEAIASLKEPKIALLNCCHDRETTHMSALDYIDVITHSLNRYGALSHAPQAYITHLFVVEGTSIPVEEEAIRQLGIQVHRIASDSQMKLSVQNQCYPVYASQELIQSISQVIAKGTTWTHTCQVK